MKDLAAGFVRVPSCEKGNVRLVASSDSHHCASVGGYSYVRQMAGPARVA